MSIATERQTSVTVAVGEESITFETGKLAKQADGAVVVRAGETMVLATAVGRPEAREGADFFPLTVDVEERMYAAGKIPGGFFKREGRATERATLTARMIDRPIRPLWPKGFRNEVQVICTVLSADLVAPHDILCINGASAALMISSLPFFGPVGAVRIGLIDGKLVVNPTLQESYEESELDLIVVGTKDALTMVEAGANVVPEETLLEALDIAQGEIRKLCEAQEELRAAVGKPKWLDMELTAELEGSHGAAIDARIQGEGLREAGAIVDELVEELSPPVTMESTEADITRRTQVRSSLQPAAREAAAGRGRGPGARAVRGRPRRSHRRRAGLEGAQVGQAASALRADRRHGRAAVPGRPRRRGKDSLTKSFVKKAAEAIYKNIVRRKIAIDKRRPDGRSAEEIRPIECEVGVVPAHARLGPLHARADADPHALHARHREGGPADRRPLPRERPSLHAPLQLPALLGRGDGLHARPEAA